MAVRERLHSRSLRASFHPRVPDRLQGLLFHSARPGRRSVGDRALDNLDELLVVAGLRLLILALFADLVTGDVIPLTAFNTAIAFPVVAVWIYHRLGPDHGLGDIPIWRRLDRWWRLRVAGLYRRARLNPWRRRRLASWRRRRRGHR